MGWGKVDRRRTHALNVGALKVQYILSPTCKAQMHVLLYAFWRL